VTPNHLLGGLLTQLQRQEDRVAHTIAEAVRREISDYVAFDDPGAFAEVVLDTQRHLGLFVRCAPTGRMPETPEIGFIRDLARERASAGFPLEAMLHAFRVGHRVLWDWLIAQVAEAGKGDVALAITPFMHEYLGQVTRGLTEAYLEALQALGVDGARSRQDLLQALLRGDQPEHAHQLARTLGLDPDSAYVVIAASLRSPDGAAGAELLPRAETMLARRLEELGAPRFIVIHGEELVLLLPESQDRRRLLNAAFEGAAAGMTQMYGARLLAGISMTCEGLVEIRRGYHEARLALQRPSATGEPTTLADVSLYESLLALAAGSNQRRLPPWAHQIADGSRTAQNDLARTLIAYLATNLSVEECARALFVHPNTVRYRLRRLGKLTGLDMGNFYHLLELLSVMRLAPLAEAGSAVPELGDAPHVPMDLAS
jgi:hypothetical protein